MPTASLRVTSVPAPCTGSSLFLFFFKVYLFVLTLFILPVEFRSKQPGSGRREPLQGALGVYEGPQFALHLDFSPRPSLRTGNLTSAVTAQCPAAGSAAAGAGAAAGKRGPSPQRLAEACASITAPFLQSRLCNSWKDYFLLSIVPHRAANSIITWSLSSIDDATTHTLPYCPSPTL